MADGEYCLFGRLVAFSVVLKLLLIQTYYSTDFEVHRNWLALTHTLPISKWYYEATSQWTLDYPPFFAWFEYFLSQFAFVVDPAMTEIENLEYASNRTVIFQRISVIVADMILVYAAYQYYLYKCSNDGQSGVMMDNKDKSIFVCISVLFNFGLIIVDHIHFQYNGLLFGFLLLSMTRMFEDKFLCSAFWFSILLNFKHIYLYIAPAYFVYMLKRYCFKQKLGATNIWDFLPLQFAKLGCLVIFIFSLSFGPFIAMGQLKQVVTRLFPFKRGLCHAYWAPNFWALYNVLDKLLATLGRRIALINPDSIRVAAMTGGLVGDTGHIVLPSVPPIVTLILTLFAMMPCLIQLWKKPCGSTRFLKSVVLCAYSSFLFGWHVHEKAVLLILIPLSLLSYENRMLGRVFIVCSTAGNFSLLPLLFQPNETPIKIILMLLYTMFSYWSQTRIYWSTKSDDNKVLLRWFENLYIFGFVLLAIYSLFLHNIFETTSKLEFLPLLITSVYCAIGVLWSWLLFYIHFLTEQPEVVTH